jgi:hypothetical protein
MIRVLMHRMMGWKWIVNKKTVLKNYCDLTLDSILELTERTEKKRKTFHCSQCSVRDLIGAHSEHNYCSLHQTVLCWVIECLSWMWGISQRLATLFWRNYVLQSNWFLIFIDSVDPLTLSKLEIMMNPLRGIEGMEKGSCSCWTYIECVRDGRTIRQESYVSCRHSTYLAFHITALPSSHVPGVYMHQLLAFRFCISVSLN